MACSVAERSAFDRGSDRGVTGGARQPVYAAWRWTHSRLPKETSLCFPLGDRGSLDGSHDHCNMTSHYLRYSLYSFFILQIRLTLAIFGVAAVSSMVPARRVPRRQ
jgi:hypothetical protein